MVAAAKERIENLSPEETHREVSESDAVLVDIREPGERAQNGYIDGAVEAPRGMLEFWADPTSPYHRQEFDPDKRIILHCASGGRSALAASMLEELGYQRVAHMDGGIKAWHDAGMPLQQSS